MRVRTIGESIDDTLELLYDHAEVPYSYRKYIGKALDAHIERGVEKYAQDYFCSNDETVTASDISSINKRINKLTHEIVVLKQAIDGLRSGTQIVN